MGSTHEGAIDPRSNEAQDLDAVIIVLHNQEIRPNV
jgi:hypothetical protein